MKISDSELINLYGAPEREAFEQRQEKLLDLFEKRYGTSATDMFSSPGRIEICGNHTDHQKGKVLVGAVSCDMLACVSKADDVRIFSEGYGSFGFSVENTAFNKKEAKSSLAMTKGIFQGFKDAGFKVGGFHLVMNSTVFNGAGVSSSAAFELLIARILAYYYNDNNIPPFALAKIGQFSENNYFLKSCGLLDQSGIAFGGITAIDFEDTSAPKVQNLSGDTLGLEVVIVNSGDHSGLTNDYNAIREDMASVCNFFNKDVLREVSEEEFYSEMPSLKRAVSGRAILRAIHFFEEEKRVDSAVAALINRDKESFKKALNESGLSSDTYLQNYYSSGDKTQGIALCVALAKKYAPTSASRVHGGGFAGTSIIFAEKEEKDILVKKMKEVFGERNVFVASVRPSGAKHVEFED